MRRNSAVFSARIALWLGSKPSRARVSDACARARTEGPRQVDFCRAESTFFRGVKLCCSCPVRHRLPASCPPTATPSRRECGSSRWRQPPASGTSPSPPRSAACWLVSVRRARSSGSRPRPTGRRRSPPAAWPGCRASSWRAAWTSPRAPRSASARRAAAGAGRRRAGPSSRRPWCGRSPSRPAARLPRARGPAPSRSCLRPSTPAGSGRPPRRAPGSVSC